MSKQMIVPLGRATRFNEIVPFVEKIARPGMRVVFLVEWPKGGFGSLLGVQTEMETGTGTTIAARRLAESLDLQRQRRVAEEEIFPACQTLQNSGVKIDVDLYTTSLRRAVARYAANRDVHVVMMPSGIGSMFIKLFHGALSRGRLFGASTSSRVLVFYPGKP